MFLLSVNGAMQWLYEASFPPPYPNSCESSMPQQLEETGSGGEGSHDQLVTPPTTPPSQLEDACTGSSEPSSPPPDDSLSSGGEQGSLPEDSPPFMTPGGQLEYNSLFWVIPEAVVSGEGQLLLSSASSTWSNSVDSPDPLENEPLGDEGQWSDRVCLSCVLHSPVVWCVLLESALVLRPASMVQP